MCGKEYSNKYKVKAHILSFHRAGEDRSLQSECEVCGKVFKHEINMKEHAYRMHFRKFKN